MPFALRPKAYILLILKGLCFMACILIWYYYNHLDILKRV